MPESSPAGGRASVPVPPDSVRVWRGFRLASITEDVFLEKLGSVFIPSTVQIQSKVGLTAYLPTVLPRGKHASAPDEIAIVFYAYQNAYHEAKQTVGGRAYSDLHGLVFDLDRSLSGFPQKFAGTVVADGRYHLFDEPVDWQSGYVRVFVGVRDGGGVAKFLHDVGAWLTGVQNAGADAPDGAIAAASGDYVVYWEHWSDESTAGRSRIPRLKQVVQSVYDEPIRPHVLSEGLWTPYKGVRIEGGESFNFQFDRKA